MTNTLLTMIENNSQKKIKIGLAVLLAICIIALSVIYMFSSSEKNRDLDDVLDLTTAAQEKIKTLKVEAELEHPNITTSVTYIKAVEKENEGNRAFADGDYTLALNSYNPAIGFFQEALDGAEFVPEPILEPEEDKPAPEINDRKNPEPLETETKIIPQIKPKLEPNHGSNALIQELESVRKAMLSAKNAAESQNAKDFAPNTWQSASRKMTDGDKRYNSGSKIESSIRTNLNDYRNASELYLQATIEARPKKALDDKLRNDAENIRGSMKAIEKNIPYPLTIKQANKSYQQAKTERSKGSNSFNNKNYTSAKQSFAAAKRLYENAAKELKIEQDLINAAGSKPPLDEEAMTKAADRNIRKLIDNFKYYLVHEDLDKIVKLNENRAFWADFFKNVKDNEVKTSIIKKEIHLAQNTADYSFKVNMTYFNKSKGRKEKNSFTKIWELKYANGKWIVASSRIEN